MRMIIISHFSQAYFPARQQLHQSAPTQASQRLLSGCVPDPGTIGTWASVSIADAGDNGEVYGFAGYSWMVEGLTS